MPEGSPAGSEEPAPPAKPSASAPKKPSVEDGARKRPLGASLRGYNRAIHRDLGNLAVGLTLVYALSGLAVNHISDWNANFEEYTQTAEMGGPIAGDEATAAKAVLAKLGISDAPETTNLDGEGSLEITLRHRTIHADTKTGHVALDGQKPRFFLRAANWLHLNRGKKAWTWVADSYAVALILLAFSGIFMLPGRKGLLGRGGIFILLGAAVPIAYVTWSGGPDRKPTPAAIAPGD